MVAHFGAYLLLQQCNDVTSIHVFLAEIEDGLPLSPLGGIISGLRRPNGTLQREYAHPLTVNAPNGHRGHNLVVNTERNLAGGITDALQVIVATKRKQRPWNEARVVLRNQRVASDRE